MNISKTIDHTILKSEATREQVQKVCDEAREYSFASVCINPCWVSYASKLMHGTDVKICTVVGFPLGATNTETKAFEAKCAIDAGADEIDMVINIGWLKSGNIDDVGKDIAAVRASVPSPAKLKVIIEASALTREEIKLVSRVCVENQADYVKTSTGMHSTGGAKIEDVKLIRQTIGNGAKIKAAGGIKTKLELKAFLDAGADRIGCSSGVQIMEE